MLLVNKVRIKKGGLKMDNINTDILTVLSTVEVIGNNVKITEQLDRKLYLSVNQVLERIGGKWNRKEKAHVFDSNPTERLEVVINSGMINPKIKTGYFPTPPEIAKTMIELLEIQPDDVILEPSAGQGHIADFLPKDKLLLGEILPENRQILKEKGYKNIMFTDFLKYEFTGINKIIMNPPFEKQADINHVLHGYKYLEKEGILVSVMSAGVLFRNNLKTKEFRENLLNDAYIIQLPEKSFKSSGTNVNAILVKIKNDK